MKMGFTSQDHLPRSGIMPDPPVLVLVRASYNIIHPTGKIFDSNLSFVILLTAYSLNFNSNYL